MKDNLSPEQLLQFYIDIGLDEAIEAEPTDKTKVTEKVLNFEPASATASAPTASTAAKQVKPATAVTASPAGTIEALEDAKALAASAQTLEELRTAIDAFKGLSIKRTATQMVFADGPADARIMVIGEAPGADEDRIGRPFVGVSGQLLDKMLASVGLSRESNAYITNILNWRPPGNRSPSDDEIALSLPFIHRHIELLNPAIIVLAGGVATKAILNSAAGITRLHGKWVEFSLPNLKAPVPVIPTFHPAYLLRSPQQKALAWQDLLRLKAKMAELGLKISG